MVPASPTAQPVFASMKNTASIARVDPVTCGFQVAPPSVVRRMVLMLGLHDPWPPTAIPVLASVNQTPLSVFLTPLTLQVQLAPPLVVRWITLRNLPPPWPYSHSPCKPH
jgi:hypothetical protein